MTETTLMIRTLEAVVDQQGTVRLLEAVTLPQERRALVTILDEPPAMEHETTLLGEGVLQDWNRPEEEAAWSHLQQVRKTYRNGECRTTAQHLRRC